MNFGPLERTFETRITEILSQRSLRFENFRTIEIPNHTYDTSTQVTFRLLTEILISIEFIDASLINKVSETLAEYDKTEEIINGLDLFRLLKLLDIFLSPPDEFSPWYNSTSLECRIKVTKTSNIEEDELPIPSINKHLKFTDHCLEHNRYESRCTIQMCYQLHAKVYWHEKRTGDILIFPINVNEIFIDKRVSNAIKRIYLCMFNMSIKEEEVTSLLIIVNKLDSDISSHEQSSRKSFTTQRERHTDLIIDLINRRRERDILEMQTGQNIESIIGIIENRTINKYSTEMLFATQDNYHNTTYTTELREDNIDRRSERSKSILLKLFEYFKDQILERLDNEFRDKYSQDEFERDIVLPILISRRLILTKIKEARIDPESQNGLTGTIIKLMIIMIDSTKTEEPIITRFLIERILTAIDRQGFKQPPELLRAWVIANAKAESIRSMAKVETAHQRSKHQLDVTNASADTIMIQTKKRDHRGRPILKIETSQPTVIDHTTDGIDEENYIESSPTKM